MPQKAAGEAGRSAVRRSRRDLGLTQEALASRCAEAGVPVAHSHISKIERGLYSPRPPLRRVLAQLLDLDPSVFDTEQPEGSAAA
ncbi:helix-turn-helix domain-containing protein [Streptomyces erythrochromogenes]|uniref:helix-turn-helix domain-containing protein n=1 Tax=Streptomyces erythrochromogenes TaxID=285574 RepID=UPI0036BB2096